MINATDTKYARTMPGRPGVRPVAQAVAQAVAQPFAVSCSGSGGDA